MTHFLTFVFLTALFAVTNRVSGAGRLWEGNGRNIYYTAPACAAVVWLVLGPWMAVSVLGAWIFYRIPGFFGAIDMGRNDHTYWRDMLWTFLNGARWGIGFAIFFALYILLQGSAINVGRVFVAMLLCGAWSGVAVTCGYVVAHQIWWWTSDEDDRASTGVDPGPLAEWLAGAALGMFWGQVIIP